MLKKCSLSHYGCTSELVFMAELYVAIPQSQRPQRMMIIRKIVKSKNETSAAKQNGQMVKKSFYLTSLKMREMVW